MGVLSEENIIAIRQKADIVDIVSDYIKLTPKGKNYFAVCPFHDDHNPSMVVSKEKQIFNCFTCHTGGNVFTFVMKYENVSFLEAVKIVANKLGMSVNIHTDNKPSRYKKEYDVMDLSNKYFSNIINTAYGKDAKEYLHKRGITDAIIKDFKIGLATDSKDDLYKFLTKHKYENDILVNVGLVNKSGIDMYDVFTNRIMIPICNADGQIVGYTGRIYHGEDQAKYVNTKDTKIYIKGEILFNYHNAKNYVREEGKLIVVEGNMDAIKMYASGYKNVVALMGTALTKFQVDLLKKVRLPIVLMLDNDDAGLMATTKVGKSLKDNNIDVEVVRLDGAKDPDEFIEKYGKLKFDKVIKFPVKYIDFMLNELKKEHDVTSTEGMVSYIKGVIELLNKEDDLTKEVIASKVAKENNIDIDVILSKLSPNKKEDVKNKLPVQKVKSKNNFNNELCNRVLYYLMLDQKYINIFADEVGFFTEKYARDIFNEIKFIYKNSKEPSLADIIAYFGTSLDLSDIVLTIINNNDETKVSYEDFNELLKALKKYNTNQEIKEIKKKIKEENNIEKKLDLIEKLAKIKKGCVDDDRD